MKGVLTCTRVNTEWEENVKGLAWWILAGWVLSGCATRTGNVDQRMLLPDSATHYEMQPHQAFVFPLPQHNPAPVLPASLVVRELPPTTVCIAFVVDVRGVTSEVKRLEQPGCETQSKVAHLQAAAMSAVATWRFSPAMFCEYPDAATRERDWNGDGCAGDRVETSVVPVSLAYAFTFEVRNGKGRVVSKKR